MSRNGALGPRFGAAFTSRTAPRTGITLKMLENTTGISDATLARYRDDQTKIPADAIAALDAAFTKYRMPGFMAEVYGGLLAHGGPGCLAPAAGAIAVRVAGDAAPVNPVAGADDCYWATHEGTLHRAAFGHADFARRYLDLPATTEADPRRFALDHLGWMAVTRRADGMLQLDGRPDRAAAQAVSRLAEWLDGQGAFTVIGCGLPAGLSATDAAGLLRDLAPRATDHRDPEAWSREPIDPDSIEDAEARRLWRAVHDDGIARAHLVEIAGRHGLLDRCSLMLVDGTTVITADVGAGLRVDAGAVTGRDVLARRDLAYARNLHARVIEACRAPVAHVVRRRAGGSYSSLIFARPVGPNRFQAMGFSFGIDEPTDFIPLC